MSGGFVEGGFRVDVEALKTAGLGVAELVATLAETQVSDVDCAPGAVGHAGLATQMAEYCDQWQIGMDNLTGDGQQLARHLIDCAGTYLSIDQDLAFSWGATPEDVLGDLSSTPLPPPAKITAPRPGPVGGDAGAHGARRDPGSPHAHHR